MEVIATPLTDCLIIKANLFGDDRGYFLESFNLHRFELAGIDFAVKQINFVKSQDNVLRGLHFQKGKHAQAKLVGAVSGAVLDVAVDIRRKSPTYLKHFTFKIEDPGTFLYIPRGFAHGYKSLAEGTIFFYAVDNYYSPENEGGIRYNDPNLQINWELNVDPVISEKDLKQPFIK